MSSRVVDEALGSTATLRSDVSLGVGPPSSAHVPRAATGATGMPVRFGTATTALAGEYAGKTPARVVVVRISHRKIESLHKDAMRAAIDAARPILIWPDNWDGEGSPAYRETTLDRAEMFLISGAEALWDAYRLVAPPPRVRPGPEGSIDLHWQANGRELLVNIPVGADETLGFYGDDADTKIKGEIGRDTDVSWLFVWLAR